MINSLLLTLKLYLSKKEILYITNRRPLFLIHSFVFGAGLFGNFRLNNLQLLALNANELTEVTSFGALRSTICMTNFHFLHHIEI